LWLTGLTAGVSLLLLLSQELPYGTMSDDEMRRMGIAQLQDDGVIFMWVTGASRFDDSSSGSLINTCPVRAVRAVFMYLGWLLLTWCVARVARPCAGAGA
jgi:hypothetical protein